MTILVHRYITYKELLVKELDALDKTEFLHGGMRLQISAPRRQ
jgi:hypothetical protein